MKMYWSFIKDMLFFGTCFLILFTNLLVFIFADKLLMSLMSLVASLIMIKVIYSASCDILNNIKIHNYVLDEVQSCVEEFD